MSGSDDDMETFIAALFRDLEARAVEYTALRAEQRQCHADVIASVDRMRELVDMLDPRKRTYYGYETQAAKRKRRP